MAVLHHITCYDCVKFTSTLFAVIHSSLCCNIGATFLLWHFLVWVNFHNNSSTVITLLAWLLSNYCLAGLTVPVRDRSDETKWQLLMYSVGMLQNKKVSRTSGILGGGRGGHWAMASPFGFGIRTFQNNLLRHYIIAQQTNGRLNLASLSKILNTLVTEQNTISFAIIWLPKTTYKLHVTCSISLMWNNSHSFGAVHLKELIQPNHLQLQ